MSPAKSIVGFFLRVTAFYALLLSPWHGLMDAYRVVFRTMGNVTMARLASGDASVHFVSLAANPHGVDTSVKITNKRNGKSGSIDVKSGFLGFRPTSFLVALVLATPIPRSRRGIALMLGGIGVSIFVLLRTWLQLADLLSDPSPLRVYELSAFWKSVLKVSLKVLVLTPPSGYIVPGLIWALAAFRREDWDRLFQPPSGQGNTVQNRRENSTTRSRGNRGPRRHAD